MPTTFQQRLQQLRNALLILHKALMDAERVNYEKAHGAVNSPNHFLQLLTSDSWFAWLHGVSELIVTIDEALDKKEPLTVENADALFNQVRLLLVPSKAADDFAKRYSDALQQDHDVVLAHADVMKILG